MLVIVNERSKGASGTRNGTRCATACARAASRSRRFADGVPASDRAVVDGVARGHDVVVAAGGDGTVHAVLNALIDPATDRPRGGAALGGIGLGSSNDFHKPMAAERRLGPVPARVARDAASCVDVGKARLVHPDGTQSTRYFLLNASVGIVAAGNAYFNDGSGLVRWLKRRNTEAAIMYAALVNIVRYRPHRVSLSSRRCRRSGRAGDEHRRAQEPAFRRRHALRHRRPP